MNEQFYFKQFNLACHLFARNLNVKQFYLTLRNATTQSPSREGAMAIKGYSAFPKALLEPLHQIV